MNSINKDSTHPTATTTTTTATATTTATTTTTTATANATNYENPLEPPSYNYYPSVPVMEMKLNNNNAQLPPPSSPSVTKLELNLFSDQLMKTKATQDQSMKCTVCRDINNDIVFYRPSMALHTLFQVQDEDDPSSLVSGSRYDLVTNNNSNNNNNKNASITNNNNDTTNSMVTLSGNGKGGDYHQHKKNKSLDLNKDNYQHQFNHGKNHTKTKIDNKHEDEDDIDDSSSSDHDSIHQAINKDEDGDYDEDMDQNQRLVIPKHMQHYVTLYDALNDDKPLWSFIEQNWHYMTFLSRQPSLKPITMTTSTFSFFWDTQQQQQQSFPYRWRMHMDDNNGDQHHPSMDLLCEIYKPDQNRREIIASLTQKSTKMTFFKTTITDNNNNNNNNGNTTSEATTISDNNNNNGNLKKISSNNPFRHLNDNKTTTQFDTFDSFIVISGLLLYDLIQSQLRALGGGKEAMMMMIDRQQEAIKEEEEKIISLHPSLTKSNPNNYNYSNNIYNGINNIDIEHDDDDELEDLEERDQDRIHSAYYQQDIDHRWSSNGSMKSLELDPGMWRCWWGYGCWWNVVPCCMPGGWCDRLWLKVRGIHHKQQSNHHRHHRHRSKVTRRMQGWQQQEE